MREGSQAAVGTNGWRRAGAGVKRRLAIGESIETARTERLLLQQGIANPPQVHAKLQRMIAENLRPSIRKIDICL
jgi:hypothetical protein